LTKKKQANSKKETLLWTRLFYILGKIGEQITSFICGHNDVQGMSKRKEFDSTLLTEQLTSKISKWIEHI
jgi:hypothetical protein